MTAQEKQQLAELICGNLESDEWGEMADILFDTVENSYNAADVEEISIQLFNAGVDVKPICKRKHPV